MSPEKQYIQKTFELLQSLKSGYYADDTFFDITVYYIDGDGDKGAWFFKHVGMEDERYLYYFLASYRMNWYKIERVKCS